jgi:hypothetical protein
MKKTLEEMKKTLLKMQEVARWDSESPWDRDSKDALVAFSKVTGHYIDHMIVSGHIQHTLLKDCVRTLEITSELTCIPEATTLIRELDTLRGKTAGHVDL